MGDLWTAGARSRAESWGRTLPQLSPPGRERERERERPNGCHSLTQWVVGRAYGLRVGMPTPTPCRKKERTREPKQSKANEKELW